MKKRIIIKYILFIGFLLIIFTGCSMNNNENNVKDKTIEEISYFEDEIFVIVNKYVKGEYLKDNVLDWNEISKEVKYLNVSLDTFIADLIESGVSNEDVLVIRNEFNNIVISCGNNDEYNFFQKIGYVYSLLPNYFEKCSKDKNKLELLRLKGIVLTSFIQSNFLDWNSAKSSIASAETKYKEMSENVDYMKEYSYNLNKVYILLKELKNAIDLEELELVKLKYINFIEKV